MQDVDFLICSINSARKLRELDGVWGGELAGYENSGEINFCVEDKKGLRKGAPSCFQYDLTSGWEELITSSGMVHFR